MSNEHHPDKAESKGSASQQGSLEDQIKQIREDIAALSENINVKASDELAEASDKLAETIDELEKSIRANPLKAAGIALGIGFIFGAILSK